MARAAALLVLCSAILAGCQSTHSAFSIGGPRARQIAELMLVFFGVSTVVYLVVIGVLIWALLRRRDVGSFYVFQKSEPTEHRARVVIAGGVAVTVLILIGLAIADFFVQRSLSSHPADSLRILLTGHQYWWEVEYDDPMPSQRLRTANEFHIPVNRPVELVLSSQDVIHSFWLPSLTGKKDLIRGYTNTEVIIAEKPGVYTGQCAEFCGLQHAKMRLTVHAVPAEDFEKWKQQQLTPAREPSTDIERHGRDVFLSSSCVLCHSIQGTPASATFGPELTHIASRGTIAAGALPNTQTTLASWVLAPHLIKPGVQMPATPLPPADLAALSFYLASLQ